MEVHLTDGTRLQCANFRAIDEGILLFDEPETEEEGDEEAPTGGEPDATGFIPHREVRYVLSEEHAQQLSRSRPQPQGTPPQQTQQQPPQQPPGGRQHRPGNIPPGF